MYTPRPGDVGGSVGGRAMDGALSGATQGLAAKSQSGRLRCEGESPPAFRSHDWRAAGAAFAKDHDMLPSHTPGLP